MQAYQQQAEELEFQVSGLRERVEEVEGEREQLDSERGRLEGEKREWERERDALREESRRCDAVEQDLGHVLQLIADGVEEGSLKVWNQGLGDRE